MPSGRRVPFPTAPDLPVEFDAAPPALTSHDVWEQVEAGVDTAVDDTVADAQLAEVVWTEAQLVQRRFTGLTCDDVRFVRADLAGALFEDCRFTRVAFESCRLTGALFGGAILHDVEFVDCVADRIDFRMARVRRTSASASSLREADFYGCELVDVRLTACELTGANFENARPERLDLRESVVDGLRGVDSLAAARIDAAQVAPLGSSLIASLGFRIE